MDYDLTGGDWIGDYDDPNTFLDLFREQQRQQPHRLEKCALRHLMREANMQTDLNKRAALLQQAERILVVDEMPIHSPLFFRRADLL